MNVASTVPTHLRCELMLQLGFHGIVAVSQLLKSNVASLRHWMNMSMFQGSRTTRDDECVSRAIWSWRVTLF